MFSGKAYRIFAATLILSTQFSALRAVAEEGSVQSVEVTASPSSFESSGVLATELSGTIPITKPDGSKVNTPVQFIYAEAPEGDEKELREFFDKEAHEEIQNGGQVGLINLLPDAAPAERVETTDLGSDLEQEKAPNFTSVALPLSQVDLYPLTELGKKINGLVDGTKTFVKDRVHDFATYKPFEGLKTNSSKRHVLRLSIVRLGANWATPLLAAMFFPVANHLSPPLWAALPFTFYLAFVSATLQLYNPAMPWNIQEKANKVPYVGKVIYWYGQEVLFLGGAQALMTIANHYGNYYEIQSFGGMLATSGVGLLAQGILFELTFGKWINQKKQAIAWMKHDPQHREAYEEKIGSLDRLRDSGAFTVSVLSVILSSGMVRGWTPAKIGFGVFIGAGLVFAWKVYNWTDLFNDKILKTMAFVDSTLSAKKKDENERSPTMKKNLSLCRGLLFSIFNPR